MNKFWMGLGIACALVVALPLHALVRRALFGPGSQTVQANTAMVRAVMDNNRWGYSLFEYDLPSISESGLTYWVDASVMLKHRKFTSVDEAERFFVKVYDDFFRTINSIRIVRPFLATFPLTPDTCRLGIGFIDEAGKLLRPPYLSSVVMEKDSLRFKQWVDSKGIAEQPYAPICVRSPREIDGLKELYSYPVPRKSVEPKPRVPPFSDHSWRFQSPVIKAQIAFLRKFCNQNSLQLVTIGSVGQHYFDSRFFEAVLCGFERLSLQEARTLGARCSQEMFDFIRKDPSCLECIKELSTKPYEKNHSPTPIPEHIAFRISFWDENIDRQPQPYIAEIRCLDGKLTYFTADENQFISQVFEETFAEAPTVR